MDVEKKLTEYRDIIEKELEQSLYSGGNFKVIEAMRYSTLGGGKRIRGVLALEFARVFGGGKGFSLCARLSAAAIEMIQAFSLVHDDLPCMDDDDERRGKPSCHKQYGEATALLAGDALLACAFNTVSAALAMDKSANPVNVVSIISTLSNATMEMIHGQQYDMEFEQRGSVDLEELLAMYNRKTCALISAACVCGAICGGAKDKQLHLARSYGVALGLAFQITDDLLDFKTEKAEKKTVPAIIGAKEAKKLAREHTDSAIKIAESIKGGEFLKELAIMLIERKI